MSLRNVCDRGVGGFYDQCGGPMFSRQSNRDPAPKRFPIQDHPFMRDALFSQERESGTGVPVQAGFAGLTRIASVTPVFQQQESVSGCNDVAKLVHPVSNVARVAVQQQNRQSVSVC